LSENFEEKKKSAKCANKFCIFSNIRFHS
jgi:hypothetical protein